MKNIHYFYKSIIIIWISSLIHLTVSCNSKKELIKSFETINLTNYKIDSINVFPQLYLNKEFKSSRIYEFFGIDNFGRVLLVDSQLIIVNTLEKKCINIPIQCRNTDFVSYNKDDSLIWLRSEKYKDSIFCFNINGNLLSRSYLPSLSFFSFKNKILSFDNNDEYLELNLFENNNFEKIIDKSSHVIQTGYTPPCLTMVKDTIFFLHDNILYFMDLHLKSLYSINISRNKYFIPSCF